MDATIPLPVYVSTDSEQYRRLRWRCRRGLLENDLILDRFFKCHGDRLALPWVEALIALMDLPDNDLLDLFLGRQKPIGEWDKPGVWHILTVIRGSHSFI